MGAAAAGPNPTDLDRPGTSRYLITERQGIPLTTLLTNANRHDTIACEVVVDAVPGLRCPLGQRRKRPPSAVG